MMRLLTVALALLLLGSTIVEAAAPTINEVTLGDIAGPRMPKAFRDGVITGVFMAIAASGAVSCPLMSAKILQAGIESALQAKEITDDWTVYRAAIHVLVRAGCTAAPDNEPKPSSREKPNA